jgi:hypothetical protein
MSYSDRVGDGYESRDAGNQAAEPHRPQRGDVFLRADFEDLGGYDQVGRVLRKIVREGRLVRRHDAGLLRRVRLFMPGTLNSYDA